MLLPTPLLELFLLWQKKKLGMAVVMTSVIHFYFGVKQSMLMQVFLSSAVFEPVINRSMLHVKAA